jgi:Right handed beta helix region
MIAFGGAFMKAEGQTGNPPPTRAALRLQHDGTYDLHGQVVRCKPGEKVGIWAQRRFALSVANAVIEGCEIGILVTSGATGDMPGDVIRDLTQRGSARVEGVTVRATTVGIWLAGNGSTASNNIVGGAKYGIVVTGDDNTLTSNQSNDNIEDGFLVTGDRNLLEGNEARRNGGIGIHVARMVPMVERSRFLSFFQDRGLGNVIRGNIAIDNTRDLVEFAENCDGNDWINNTFETRRPECIK